MVQHHWGHKRTCPSCNERFYDMQRSPIICPHCNATLEIQSSSRGRRRSLKKEADAIIFEKDMSDSLVDDDLDDLNDDSDDDLSESDDDE